MKIVFLNIYQDLVNRGAETFVYELANRLCQKHEVILIQGKETKKQYKTVIIAGVKTLPTDDLSMSWRLAHKFYLDPYSRQVFSFTKKSLPFIEREKPDWVIPLNGFWQLWQIKKLQTKLGFKVLVSGQAGPGKDDFWNLKLKPDIFVALTTHQSQWAKQVSKNIKIETVPNGVDLNKFSKTIEPVKINLPRPIIICVGALVPYKKIDLTIRAVSKLPFKASLIIIGQGLQKERLKKLCDELLPHRHLITTVNFEKMPSYYSVSDLFTLASAESEAFGIAYLEALASGKAVVAPNYESRKEIISEAGLFFEPDDIESYAMSLKTALDKNWGDLPYNQAKKFDWDNIAKKYEKLMLENL